MPSAWIQEKESFCHARHVTTKLNGRLGAWLGLGLGLGIKLGLGLGLELRLTLGSGLGLGLGLGLVLMWILYRKIK